MAFNMNDQIRRRGNRSRALPGGFTPPQTLPNIGQTPAVQAANVVLGAQAAAATQSTAPAAPTPAPAPAPSPYAAPPVQPTTAVMSPPGTPADPNMYNYEPEADGAWRVYPPGVPAPPHMAQASLPRAASTADYRRMRDAFQQLQTP